VNGGTFSENTNEFFGRSRESEILTKKMDFFERKKRKNWPKRFIISSDDLPRKRQSRLVFVKCNLIMDKE
jgi:hypothetical protein